MSQHLVIVESPTKAKTIAKFLGKDYTVLSSFGHVRDLPKSKLGVDPEHNFAPSYVVPTKSKQQVATLKAAAKKADEVLLATDADREGEAIAWHVASILNIKPEKTKRIAFHEITKHAIEEAVAHPRTLDMNLVNAQQARRILDRLVGYELSPFLWQKVRRGLSAGRVQSVALRLVVERERERKAFKIDEYWTIDALFSKKQENFPARLSKISGKKIEKEINDKTKAAAIVKELNNEKFIVAEVQKTQVAKNPPTPLTTSSLQMEANQRLGFSAKQTMMLAQSLYETGRITYMRTDSMNLAEKFLQETQAFLSETLGAKYALGIKQYKTNKKGAQEAHEAIRPTHIDHPPDTLQGELEARSLKLYDLIWRRTIATQMPPAQLERTGVDITADKYTFRANGNIVLFDGFMKYYRGGAEKILPELTKGEEVTKEKLEANQHFTEPPARYSDATLVKTLEEYGIGRPSTYAPTINTIIVRGYVERDEQKKLAPTEVAFIVNDILVEHFSDIVDYQFTANLEKELDEIADGDHDWVPTLRNFYQPFHKNILSKTKTLTREDVMKERVLGKDPKTGLDVIVRTGRFGPYAQLGEWSEEDKKAKINKPRSTSLLKDMDIETVTLKEALKMLQVPKVVGKTEEGVDIVADLGRYGPYLKAGTAAASLEDPQKLFTINEAEARALLKEAVAKKKQMTEPIANLGDDPESKKTILVKNGRFGPYVTDGKINASVSKKIDPKTVTLEMAIELLAKKQARKFKPRHATTNTTV